MAGHSKWANIKHRKERADQKKGKIFSRITKEIISAVKLGGKDPKSNPRLRMVLEKARKAGLPKENIERNIKKASQSDVADYTEVIYELYGYGGVGILAIALTDNKNRTASSMRIATNKRGGSIATPGSVLYNFDKKGALQIPKKGRVEEDFFSLISNTAAEDFVLAEEDYLVITSPEDLYVVKDLLDKEGIESDPSLEFFPKQSLACSKEDREKNMALIQFLEELEDVDDVYHTMEL